MPRYAAAAMPLPPDASLRWRFYAAAAILPPVSTVTIMLRAMIPPRMPTDTTRYVAMLISPPPPPRQVSTPSTPDYAAFMAAFARGAICHAMMFIAAALCAMPLLRQDDFHVHELPPADAADGQDVVCRADASVCRRHMMFTSCFSAAATLPPRCASLYIYANIAIVTLWRALCFAHIAHQHAPPHHQHMLLLQSAMRDIYADSARQAILCFFDKITACYAEMPLAMFFADTPCAILFTPFADDVMSAFHMLRRYALRYFLKIARYAL